LNVEVNGEQLQVLSRLYWMTGEQKYLDWAIRLGDYYLLGENHPTRDFEALRLNDHGCEIVSGLCELYASVHFARPGKKEEYREAIHEMLDRILEVGRNEDGLFYVSVNPQTGEILEDKVRDNWGYNYNGYYTVYLLDGEERYREALLLAFSRLDKYRNYDWEGGSADGFADAIEGCLNLYMREVIAGERKWREWRSGWTARPRSCGPSRIPATGATPCSGRTRGSSRAGTGTGTLPGPPSCTACGKARGPPCSPGGKISFWERSWKVRIRRIRCFISPSGQKRNGKAGWPLTYHDRCSICICPWTGPGSTSSPNGIA
jgi:hypothetical protein